MHAVEVLFLELVEPYNQLRFTYLTGEQLDAYFRAGYALYSALLYRNAESLIHDENSLKDYVQTGEIRPANFPKASLVSEGIANSRKLINIIAGATDRNRRTFRILISKTDLDWKTKLDLVQHTQKILWPLFGVFTFALDYITENNVNLRLFDEPGHPIVFKDTQVYNWTQSVHQEDFYSEIVSFHAKYSDLFQHEKFIKKLRDYFFAGVRLSDAAAIASMLVLKKVPANIPMIDILVRTSRQLVAFHDF
ncbi:MAG: hypothetical protein QM730_14210 [Anaerolineales bacterium]